MPRHALRLLPVLLPVLLATLFWACDAGERQAGSSAAVTQVPATHGDTLSGAKLAAALGCGACHAGAPPPDAARPMAPALVDLADRWDPGALAAYLEDPTSLREGRIARMPDFHLDEAEAAALAMHLLSGDGAPSSRSLRSGLAALASAIPGASPERGAAIAEALNCAGCHPGTGVAPWPAGPPLAGISERVRPEWLRGYLAEPGPIRPFGYLPGSGSRMPDFGLSPAEVDSLTLWLTGEATLDGPRGAPRPLSAFEADKAERMLRDHLSCLGCHMLGSEGGRIAPRLDDAATRLEPAYLRHIVTDPARAAPGTIMPTPLEDSATLTLVLDYLEQKDPAGPLRYLSLVENAPMRLRPGSERTPSHLYASHCAVCHGRGGRSDGFNAANLPSPPTAHADTAHMAARPDATLFDGIHAGGHILGRSHRMPGFGATLSRSEIRALVLHLRDLCACSQPEWASP